MSTRCVQKAANNFWLCRKGKPFAHQGQPLPSIDKTMEQLAGVLLLMRESFLQGDERIIRSIDRDRADGESGDNRSIGGAPARSASSGFKGRDRAAVAPPFGTDLTCRSIWDAGVSGFISDAHHTTSKPSHGNSSTELFISNQYDGQSKLTSSCQAASQIPCIYSSSY